MIDIKLLRADPQRYIAAAAARCSSAAPRRFMLR